MILVEETDNRFYIKESTIPEGGLGVFANEDLKKGDYLEIIGVRLKRGSVVDDCTHYGNSYKFSARPGEDLNNDIILPVGYAAIVNHAPTKGQQNAAIDVNRNPPRNPAAGIVVYKFLREILKDEEIFGNYGENWDVALAWASKQIETVNSLKDDWETFMEFNVYNLNVLEVTHAIS